MRLFLYQFSLLSLEDSGSYYLFPIVGFIILLVIYLLVIFIGHLVLLVLLGI